MESGEGRNEGRKKNISLPAPFRRLSRTRALPLLKKRALDRRLGINIQIFSPSFFPSIGCKLFGFSADQFVRLGGRGGWRVGRKGQGEILVEEIAQEKGSVRRLFRIHKSAVRSLSFFLLVKRAPNLQAVICKDISPSGMQGMTLQSKDKVHFLFTFSWACAIVTRGSSLRHSRLVDCAKLTTN